MKLNDAPPEVRGRAFKAAVDAWTASLRDQGIQLAEGEDGDVEAYEAFAKFAGFEAYGDEPGDEPRRRGPLIN